jgi:hypothetical protein
MENNSLLLLAYFPFLIKGSSYEINTIGVLTIFLFSCAPLSRFESAHNYHETWYEHATGGRSYWTF